MELFSADATMSSKKNFFDHENIRKQPSKVAHNQPKISPNLTFCSIKKAPSATSIFWLWYVATRYREFIGSATNSGLHAMESELKTHQILVHLPIFFLAYRHMIVRGSHETPTFCNCQQQKSLIFNSFFDVTPNYSFKKKMKTCY